MAQVDRHKKIKALCLNCGKEYYGNVSDVLSGKRRFCSVKCSAKLGGKARGPLYGELNPNWKGGISKNHYHYKKIQVSRYPERIKARQAIIHALRSGKLMRQPCIVCDDTKAHAHHEDYSKPLEVIWLCRKHHREKHGNKH